MDEPPDSWRDPVFGRDFGPVPGAPRDVLDALAVDADGTTQRRIFYERLHVLIAVWLAARRSHPERFDLTAPPSAAEHELGELIGQAFHQGCSAAAIGTAADIAPERVVEIGRRTIRRTGWLDRV